MPGFFESFFTKHRSCRGALRMDCHGTFWKADSRIWWISSTVGWLSTLAEVGREDVEALSDKDMLGCNLELNTKTYKPDLSDKFSRPA